MSLVGKLIDKTKSTLDKTTKFMDWCRDGRESMNINAEEGWPRVDEYKIIEDQIRNFARLTRYGADNFKSHESFLDCYAKDTRRRYRAGEIEPEPGDSSSPYRVLLAAEAEASTLWLRYALDFLDTLEEMPMDGKEKAPHRIILFATASPRNQDRLRVDAEERAIREELERCNFRDNFRFENRGACRPVDFVRSIVNLRPEIVHFSGHGSINGELIFEDEIGQGHAVPANALTNIFQQCIGFVECVILNACFTERQAKEISNFIPNVMGMSTEVLDDTAISFSSTLYMGIGNGLPYLEAFNCAVSLLNMEDGDHANVPMIVQRLQ